MPAAGAARWMGVTATIPSDLPGLVEVVADRLWMLGPAAIEEREVPVGTMLLAGFTEAGRAEVAAAVATRAGCSSVTVATIEDHGLDGWRTWARPEHAGPFDLVPSWLDAPSQAADRLVLRIDPGTTFGSGSHPTTRLVLARLARLATEADVPPARVLDVGCGSGILSVAAARLGTRSVTAIDSDPHAPAVTATNAARNQVAARISATDHPLAQLAATGQIFDVVLANLLAPVVTELASDLVAVLSPTGRLVVSGLLADRWEATVAHLRGVEPLAVDLEDGWAAITLCRSHPSPGAG
ncbi:hypothetical protein BH23ACT2_BH23ACT2_14560 [soil metagenome]